jgi:hypothetical protein
MKPMIQEFDDQGFGSTIGFRIRDSRSKAISGVGRGKEASRKCDIMRTCH